MDLNWLSIAEATRGLQEKTFSAAELVQACESRIQATDELNSFITRNDAVLGAAKAMDAAGDFTAPLAGIPAGIKDNFNVKGFKATNGSKMLETYVAPYEATSTRKLWEAGALHMGKLNMDDAACGTSGESSYFGPVKNPWDLNRVAGGSSSGSAASVAAGQVLFALGSDTGGSIRLPASFCGVVGLKPTYGRISRFGNIAMASSFDTVGTLTRSVEDAARLLQVMAGKDVRDATTSDVAVPDYSKNLKKGVEGLTIGVPKEYFGEGVDEEIQALVRDVIDEYVKMGANVKEISLEKTKYGVAVYYVLVPSEFSANTSRLDGVRFGHKPEAVDTSDLIEYYKHSRGEGFGPEIKRRIMVGTFALSAGYADAYYKQAQRVRTLFIQEFDAAFKEVDVIVAPVSPSVAFKLGEFADDPMALYMADMLTIPANTAGIPSLSLPCGFTKAGLPVNFQVMGPQWSEELVFQVGAAYEQTKNWGQQRPMPS